MYKVTTKAFYKDRTQVNFETRDITVDHLSGIIAHDIISAVVEATVDDVPLVSMSISVITQRSNHNY